MTLDLILNTVSADHEVSNYMNLLGFSGTCVQLGLVIKPHAVSQMPLVKFRQNLTGSHIGGIAATEECLTLCAEHGIIPDIQIITANQIDWAW